MELFGLIIAFIVIIACILVGSIVIASLKIKNVTNENNQKIAFLTQQKDQLEAQCQTVNLKLAQEIKDHQALNILFVQQKTLFAEQKKNLEDKILFLNQSEQRLSDQFQKLAQDIFQSKQKEINESTQTNLNLVLNPFKTQLNDFKQQIQTHYEHESKERHTLKHEITNLQQMNQNLAQEAVNLTNALKGNNKIQGNWGELILIRLLENAGLKEGIEFKTQESFDVSSEQISNTAKKMQPDVIVYLPKNRQVIIDSKVSLVAYERYFNAETEAEKQDAFMQNVNSITNHINELSKKQYDKNKKINTLDYVLMFIPIENALQTAIMADPNLLKSAADKNILLITPTSLMVTLRTIHSLWQQEYKNANAEAIAKKAAGLYDKFVNFVDDLEKLGSHLEKSQEFYAKTTNKLFQGKGNLIKNIEGFKEMGIVSNKSLTKAKMTSIQHVLIDDQFEESEDIFEDEAEAIES